MKVIALLFGLENLKILYLYRFPCDDSEVTLNVCLGKQFSGGELFLRGVRCEDNVNAETQSEFFIVVSIDMVRDPQNLGIQSTYCYGAEETAATTYNDSLNNGVTSKFKIARASNKTPPFPHSS
ncbi:putative PKHD-type hydroxylase [Camellia lanceoleosa]|uniref:PKHD-type hydroxylase n=1 Tax=Camellia lanceoleosa TaxID=1840588 RepID=A0ACC0GAM4_9ERIC|nr:putative PKHD-type hydroxylase [Camellia lanceoleosa]